MTIRHPTQRLLEIAKSDAKAYEVLCEVAKREERTKIAVIRRALRALCEDAHPDLLQELGR